MESLEKLFELRKSLARYEQDMGFEQLSEVEKAVLAFIMHTENANITAITKDQYFAKYSLSTIKRAVGVLLEKNIISATQSSADKRAMVLTYKQ